MPLYEYHCRSCYSEFDMLRKLSDRDDEIECPVCRSRQIKRKMSVSAAPSHNGNGSISSAVCNSRFT